MEDKARERLAGHASAFPHYMGAVLLSPRGKFAFGTIPVFDVVDGQQRLTTYQLVLSAFRDLATSLDASTMADQLSTFLVNAANPLMKDPKTERYKLQPSAYDRVLSRDLVDLDRSGLKTKYADSFYKNGNIKDTAPLPLRAWWYFRSESSLFVDETGEKDQVLRLAALVEAVLEDFRVIVITLDETDDAQVIFETLNSGGEPLAAMDLVRNDVFHRAIRRGEDPDSLMEKRWHVFENPFWKEEATQGRIKKPRIDFFLAHTLAATTGKEVLLTELYARYKAYVSEQSFATVDQELGSLVRYAPTYRTLVSPVGAGDLQSLATQLSVFDMSTAFPLVFVIAEGAQDEQIAKRLYSLVSSYVIRRALCGLTAKAYNSTLLRVTSALRTRGVSESAFAGAFADAEGDTVRFPTDQELTEAIRSRRQYKSMPTARLAYIIAQFERASHDKFDETVGLRSDLTIEHVLPDKWAEHWPLPNGDSAPMDYVVGIDDARHALIASREAAKHTLGNLTLLTPAGNPRLGNLPYTVSDAGVGMSKREALRKSLLKMNHEIADCGEWSEREILN